MLCEPSLCFIGSTLFRMCCRHGSVRFNVNGSAIIYTGLAVLKEANLDPYNTLHLSTYHQGSMGAFGGMMAVTIVAFAVYGPAWLAFVVIDSDKGLYKYKWEILTFLSIPIVGALTGVIGRALFLGDEFERQIPLSVRQTTIACTVGAAILSVIMFGIWLIFRAIGRRFHKPRSTEPTDLSIETLEKV